ncbi:MAG: alpha/beta hydrolase [Actinomycetota bacterium]
MKISTQVIPVAGGRSIWVDSADFGEGFPVLVHAGSPGSRRLFGPAAQRAATQYGLRLISYDRPGFGDTPAQPGRTVASAAAETRAIADGLGLSRLAVWGFSGGGPYALACAALLPDLVSACCVLACLAPYDSPGLDFSASWSAEHREEVQRFFDQPELARENFRAEAAELFEVLTTAEGWLSRWGDAAGTDAAHSREVAEYLALVQQDCSRQGDQGWWDDWAAFLGPWGFDLAAIRVPVQLWQGANDTAVPAAHGHWLAGQIPGVDAHFPEAEDHTNIEAAHQDEAYQWILERS